MATNPKPQFVTIATTRASTLSGVEEMTLAVDEIKRIEDVTSDMPVYRTGSRAVVIMKGKDGEIFHASESRESIVAKIKVLDRPQPLLSLRQVQGSNLPASVEILFVYADEKGVPLAACRTESGIKSLGLEWLMQSARNGTYEEV